MGRAKQAEVLGAPRAPAQAAPLGRRATKVGCALCLIGAALGAVGLLGWITGMSWLAVLLPGAPRMPINAAVSLVLIGVAAALRRHEATPPALRVLTGAAAALVLAIGVGTLVEYAFGFGVGIDQLLSKSGFEGYPGRPSPPTALALILLALALLLFDARPRAGTRPSEWMILTAGLLGFVAIVGITFGAGALYRMGSASVAGVAMPTALGLILVSAGMFLERPTVGIARLATAPGPGGALLRRLVLPGMLLPMLLAFGLSRLFNFFGVRDVALLLATLIALTTVVSVALLAISARPLDRAHQALEASRSLTRELLEQAPDGIFVADLDGRYTDVNQAGCDLVGFSREELLGKTVADLLFAEDLPRLALTKQQLLGGRSETAEWRLRRKDGTHVLVELNAKILADGRWQAFVRDITERKRTEDALRASEARYSGLVSIADDAIISVNESQRIVIFNKGAEQIFGWTAVEVLGQPLDILIPERLREKHSQHVRDFASQAEKARRMGTPSSIAGLRKNGEEFPAEAAISKLLVEGGLILTVVLRDVTEQRRAANEERFFAQVGAVLATTLDFEDTLASVGRLAVGALADVCVVESGEDRDSIRRLTFIRGDARDAGAGHHLRGSAAVPRPLLGWAALQTDEPLLVPEVTDDLLESLADSDENLRALHALDPDSLIALPLVAQGARVGSLILIRTTPSHRYGPRDLFLAQELARRAALAIESARLYRVAQRAIHARDDVLGIVAHDLRNPLTAVAMQAEALVRTLEGNPRAHRAAQAIGRAAARMNRLIQDLLDVTRIEAGYLSIDPSPQPTAQIVAEALEAQKPLTGAAAIELEGQLAPDLPDVMADRDRLIEVFENLIGNATKFAPRGGRVTVGAEPRGADVLFWVADNGPGIASDLVIHLFDRFWQAKRADRRGAGLGLPIVKGIVEAHGGHAWVETAPGSGTTFFFTIPAAAGSSDWQSAPVPH